MSSRLLLICAVMCTVACATDCISTSQSGDLTLTSGPHRFETCMFSGTLTLNPGSTVAVTGSGLATAVASNLITISVAGVYNLVISGSTLALVGSGSRFITITAQMNAGSVLNVTGNVFTGVDAGIEATGAIVDVTTLSICDNSVDVMVAAGTRMAFVRLASVSVNGPGKTFNVSGNARAVTSPNPYDVSVVGSLTVLEVVGEMQVGNAWWPTGVAVTYAHIDSNRLFQAVLVVGRISASWNCALVSISHNIIHAKNVRNGSPIMLGEALGMNLQQWLPTVNITYNTYRLEQTTASADSNALLTFAAIFIGGSSLLNGFVNVLHNDVSMMASVEQGALWVVGVALAVRTGSPNINGFQAPLSTSYNAINITCAGPQCTAYAIGEVGGDSLQISMNTQGLWLVIGNSGEVTGGVFAAFWVVTSTLDISSRNLTITSNAFKVSSTSLVVYDLRLQRSINVGGPVTITDNVFLHTDATVSTNAMLSVGGDLNSVGPPLVIHNNVVSGGNPNSQVVTSDTSENINGGSQVSLCGNDMSGRVVYGSSNTMWVSDSCGYPANATITTTTSTTTSTLATVPPGVASTTTTITGVVSPTTSTTTTTTTTPCAPNCTSEVPDSTPDGPTDSTGPTIGTGATVTATSFGALDTASTIQIAALLSIMACRTGGADSEAARYLLSPLRIPGTGVVGDLVGSGLILLGGTVMYLCVSMLVFRCVRSRAPKPGDAIAPEDMLPGDGPTLSEERARELGDLRVFNAKKWLFYPRVPLLLMVLLYTSIVNESARILFGNLHSSAEWWGILLAVIGMLYGLGVLAASHLVAVRVVKKMTAGSTMKDTPPHHTQHDEGAVVGEGGDKYRTPGASAPDDESTSVGGLELREAMGEKAAMMELSQLSVDAGYTLEDGQRSPSEWKDTAVHNKIVDISGKRRCQRSGSIASENSSICEMEPSPQTQFLYSAPPMELCLHGGFADGAYILSDASTRRSVFSMLGGGESIAADPNRRYSTSSTCESLLYPTDQYRIRDASTTRPSPNASINLLLLPGPRGDHSRSPSLDQSKLIEMVAVRALEGCQRQMTPPNQGTLSATDEKTTDAEFSLVAYIPESTRQRNESEPELTAQLALRAKDTLPSSDPLSDTWLIEYSPEDVEKQLWIIRNTLLAVGHWNTFVGRSMYCLVVTYRPQGVSWLVCHNLWRVFLVSVVAAISPGDKDDCRYVQGAIVAICIAHGLLVIVSRVYRIPALNPLQGLQSILLGLMACSPFISNEATQDGIGNTLLALSLLTALLSLVALALEFQLQRHRSKKAYRETQ